MKTIPLIVVAFVLSAGAGDASKPLPPGAIGPLRHYSISVDQADIERGRAVAKAKAILLDQLKAAQAAALKANKEDDALAIAALIKENTESVGRTSGRQAFVGKVIHGADGWSIRLNDDGSFTHTDAAHWSGKWEMVDDSTVLLFFTQGPIDIWKISKDGKIHGDAYVPHHSYEAKEVSGRE